MALAPPDVHGSLIAARQLARASGRFAANLPKRVGWLVVLAVVTVAIGVTAWLQVRDPVLRRLDEAPVDDEPLSSDDAEELRRARAEAPIPWETAKQQLIEPD